MSFMNCHIYCLCFRKQEKNKFWQGIARCSDHSNCQRWAPCCAEIHRDRHPDTHLGLQCATESKFAVILKIWTFKKSIHYSFYFLFEWSTQTHTFCTTILYLQLKQRSPRVQGSRIEALKEKASHGSCSHHTICFPNHLKTVCFTSSQVS